MAKLSGPTALWDYSLPDRRTERWGGYRVFDAATRRLVDADEADQAIIRDYPFWVDKGPLIDGTRLTLTTARAEVALGEPVRVAHIVEETRAGRRLFVVGPKPVRHEQVDAEPLAGLPPGDADYPWLPADYDGEAAPAPGIDDNFEITVYRFDRPGIHRIVWRPGRYRSNELVLTVRAPP